MGDTKKGHKTKKIINYIVIFLIAIIMIVSGIYLFYINSPQKLFSNLVDKAIIYLENNESKENITGISKNYTLKSNIKFNLESKILENSTDIEDLEIKNLLKNLNDTTNDIVFTQDTTNKKMYISINSLLNNQELLNSKYLVENSTEYYFVNGIVENYINNGNSNYFEALTENTTTKDNIIHILKTVSKSLKKNIKDEYLLIKQDKISINNKDKKVTKTSLELNNKVTKELVNNILNDLKEDSISNRILNGLNDDFSKLTISDENKIFKENEKVTINIYSNCIGKIELIEIISREGENEYRYTYESETKSIYIIENNKVVYKILCNQNGNKKEYLFYDNHALEKGKIIYDKTKDRTTISMNLNTKEEMIDIVYDSKLENIKKNKQYDNKINLNIKIISNNDNLLNATIDINNNVTNDITINEDVSTAVFASGITEEQKTLLEQKIDNVFIRLKQ